MEQVVLDVKKRESKGKNASKRFRKEGFVPANLYDKHTGSRPILLENRAFVRIASKSLTSQVLTLKSDEKDLDGQQVIVKEIQKEFLKGQVLHVDLLKLNAGEPVRVIVPLNIIGEAPGVKVQGGVLAATCHKIIVSCLPSKIPSNVEVSISTLALGQRIRTGDLQLPEGVSLRGNPKETIVSVLSGRAARISEEEVTPAKAEAGAAPAKAEGAAA